ncbi:ARM repeat-containing protein [Xylaria sp. FL1042]|nr:ARM repeat-containing protein [Xylaria sp. FL1042]
MDSEDPQERPDGINNIINGLERYNPEAVPALEEYVQHQCANRYTDSNANRTLLKLYQLNPDRVKDEVITNILAKALTCFPSPQFSLALHLIPPSVLTPANTRNEELPEAVGKLRELNDLLQSAQYARFWATFDSDDLCADLTTDVKGFEELVRVRIATLVSHAYREIDLPILEQWLGMDGNGAHTFITETAGWTVNGGLVKIPKNPENEAKKSEVREDVNVDMFSRVIRRAWEETA